MYLNVFFEKKLCSVQIATVASRPDRNSVLLHIGNSWQLSWGISLQEGSSLYPEYVALVHGGALTIYGRVNSITT